MKRLTPQTILARNVASLLAARGLTFADLGTTLGWSEKSMSDLAAGRFDARLDEIDALARVLDAQPHDLLADMVVARPLFEFAR